MIDAATRRRVRARASDRCEYCGMAQVHDPFFTFHIEHIIPRQHGGGDDLSNLALACVQCNSHKGPNLAGIDPETGEITPLFDPRKQNWEEHFERREAWIIGRTPTGRTTVRVLAMNADDQRDLRAEVE
jgi:hypothetical protein